MADNTWLKTNRRNIDGILTELESYRLKGSYGGKLNLFQIGRMIKGAISEIESLQKQLNEKSAPPSVDKEPPVTSSPDSNPVKPKHRIKLP